MIPPSNPRQEAWSHDSSIQYYCRQEACTEHSLPHLIPIIPSTTWSMVIYLQMEEVKTLLCMKWQDLLHSLTLSSLASPGPTCRWRWWRCCSVWNGRTCCIPSPLSSLSSLAPPGPIPGDGGGEDVALYEVAWLGALSDPRPTLCRLWPSEPEPQGTTAEAAGLTGKYWHCSLDKQKVT